jgi:hypothetical protein
MVIIDFAVFFPRADLSTSHALGFHRLASFEPVHHVDIVDVLFIDMITT